jgi:hypothetical protein
MRWFVRLFLLVVVLIAVYLGTAIASLQGLIADTRSANTPAIMSRIDLPRLRASLAEQITRAYFTRIEQTRPMKTFERLAAPTVVDALLAKLLTPENITKVLQSGALRADAAGAPPVTLPSLSSAGLEDATRILGRLRPKSPATLQVLLDDTGHTAIRLHFEGTHWKLSGLDLPPEAIEKLLAGIAVR